MWFPLHHSRPCVVDRKLLEETQHVPLSRTWQRSSYVRHRVSSHDGSAELLDVSSCSACPSREYFCQWHRTRRWLQWLFTAVEMSSVNGGKDQFAIYFGATGFHDFRTVLLLHDVHKRDAQRNSLHSLGPQASNCVSLCTCSWHQFSRLACPSLTLRRRVWQTRGMWTSASCGFLKSSELVSCILHQSDPHVRHT